MVEHAKVKGWHENIPSDVSDDDWAYVARYLTLMSAAATQREHDLREVFNGLRWLVRAGAGWRMLPHDLPAWEAVYQQTQRWLKAGVFEAIVHDLRVLLRLAAGRQAQPSAAIFDSRTWRWCMNRDDRQRVANASESDGAIK